VAYLDSVVVEAIVNKTATLARPNITPTTPIPNAPCRNRCDVKTAISEDKGPMPPMPVEGAEVGLKRPRLDVLEMIGGDVANMQDVFDVMTPY